MSGSVLLASSLLLAVFFGSIYREKRQAYLWAWSFNATSTTGSATVKVAFANGTPSGSVVDVVALGGNNTSTPVLAGSTTTASGCARGGCSPKTDTVTANTANAPASTR